MKTHVSLIPCSSAHCGDEGHREKFGVCSCEPHCSWDLCRLDERPIDCLYGTGSEWRWDDAQNAWVAQVEKGI